VRVQSGDGKIGIQFISEIMNNSDSDYMKEDASDKTVRDLQYSFTSNSSEISGFHGSKFEDGSFLG
jgi:hypothetical protein